ncbi:unnamed protein product [Diabrotica balteata]|uniref:peptidyl-tRNA hydrolase n=1 Tax=Diabrotica balteata TaxID=107213 RepID=A0A9N9X8A6_DIABA|nr:unnamed protein product [Diabrotica balteata]
MDLMTEPELEFRPNEEFLHQLVSMGINHDIAVQALFCTGNTSLDEAAEYVFNSQEEDARTFGSHDAKADSSDSDGGEPAEYYKMTFVVNSSLKMGVGKIAAQVGHACLGLFREIMMDKKDELGNWECYGEKKIVLKGIDESHLKELYEKAKEKNIPCYLVRDAGHTQIAPGSVTVLSLFGLEENVNSVTGKLSLL